MICSHPPATTRRVKAIDLPVRLFHWLTVLSFGLAYLLADSNRNLHQWLGYGLAVLLGLRLAWGLLGSHNARFTTLFNSVRSLPRYLRQMMRRDEGYLLTYNPLGALMIVLMLLTLAGIALTGHLLTTDAYWGDDTMSDLHTLLINGMLAWIALHLFGVLYASLRQRQNLARAMVDGYKRAD
jgi:cytochrome b